MKKLTTISLFIFGVVTAAILTAGLVFYQNNKVNAPAALNNVGNPGASITPVAPDAGVSPISGLTLNLAEIAKHGSSADCWLIINNKIYSVAGYLSAHPGGADAITPFCGKEASQAFATKGGKGSHTSFAVSLLANYYIGNLNQTASLEQIQQKVNNTNSVQPPAGGRDDDGKEEDDDD